VLLRVVCSVFITELNVVNDVNGPSIHLLTKPLFSLFFHMESDQKWHYQDILINLIDNKNTAVFGNHL
jgi:hypothetical protein